MDATTNATTIDINGSGLQLIAAGDYRNLSFSNVGTKRLGSGTTRIADTLSVGGGAAADFTTNATTIEFNGTSNQNAPGETFYNLISSNTGTRLLVNNLVVVNDLTVQSGQVRVQGGNSLTVGGTTTLNGDLNLRNGGGTNNLATVVINTGGQVSTLNNPPVTIDGDLQVDGSGTITSGNGQWTFVKSGGGTLSGTATGTSITNATFTTAYANTGNYSFGNLTISGTTVTNNGTITVTDTLSGTGTFAQGSAGVMNYNSLVAITVSSLSVSTGGNTFVYGAAGNQSVVVTNYAHLTLSGSGTKTFGSGTTGIGGTLSIGGSTAADAASNTPTIEYNGSTGQTAAGLTYYNLTTNNGAGITTNGTIVVQNTLTLTSGTLTTGTDTVRINSGGSVVRTSGHVAGNLAKTVPTGSPTVMYEIGDGSGNYTPVTAVFTGVTVGGELTTSTTTGDHPQILSSGIEPSLTVNRYWTLGGPGISYTSYDVTLNFVSGDLDGAANTANFIIGRYESAAWNLPTVGTLTSTSSQATGVIGFGEFQLGEQSTFVLKTWDGGAATNNWGDANNWNPNGVPTSSNNVNLTGANTINIGVAASVNSITLNNSSLAVTILSGNSLTASGDFAIAAGILNTETSFPSVTGTVNITGGTVGYTAGGNQTIALQSYYHLHLDGSGTKTFSTGTTNIGGDLTLGGSAAADATTNATTINYSGGGAQVVGAINYDSLTLSNAGTKTFAAGTAGIAGGFTISAPAAADATTNATTIDYNGSGAQTVRAIHYTNLTLSNGGTKTFAADTTGIAGSFTISGATADATTNATTINYNGSGAQTVRAINYTNLRFSNANTKTFAAGTTGIAGDFTLSGATADATANSTTVEYNGSVAQSVAAVNYDNLTFSVGGTKTFAAGTTGIAGAFTISGGTADALANATTIDYNGPAAQNIVSLAYFNLSLSNDQTKTLNAGTTTLGGNLTVGGTAVLDATSNATTVEYNGSGVQSSAAVTYYNLVASKAVGRLDLDDVTVANNFTNVTGLVRVANASFTVNGTTSISQELRITGTSGTKTLGDVIVNTGGLLNFAVNENLTLTGNLQVDGTGTVTSGTGLWSFQKSGGGTIGGTAPSLSITTAEFLTDYTASSALSMVDVTVTGATLTNNQSLVVTGSLNGTGSVVQGTSSSLNLSFTGTPGISSLNASAAGNTVSYNAAGNQTMLAANYYDLTLATSGTKAFAAGTTGIAGTLSITGAVADAVTNAGTVEYNGSGNQSVQLLAYHHLTLSNAGTKTFPSGTTQVAGDLTISGSAAVDATTNGSTIEYNGSIPESVASMTYYNIILAGSGAKAAAGAVTVNNNFSNSAVSSMGTFALSIAGTRTNSGTMRFAGAANGIVFSDGTVEYDGTTAAQTVASGTYNNLILSGSAAKTAAGNITANGNFSNAVVTSLGTSSLSIVGTKTNSGTMQFAGAANGVVFADGAVEYNGTTIDAPAGQTIALGVYNNLILANNAAKTVTGGTVETQSVLTVPGGVALVVAADGVLQVNADVVNQGTITNNGSITSGTE